MGWADYHIEALQRGETVQFRPSGSSMSPKVKSRQLCTVEPVEFLDVKVGDIVLCRVSGNQYLHLVKARGLDRIQIGNNKGRINGWTRSVYGRLIKVED